MHCVRCIAALVAMLLSCAASAAAPPAEVFGALPVVQTGRLSPDGKHLALIQPIDNRNGVMIYDLSAPTAKPHAVALDQAVAENILWKNNDRLLCVFVAPLKQKWSRDIYSWSRTISVDANGQNVALMMFNQDFLKLNLSGSMIADPAADDPNHVYMVAFARHDREITADLFRVDVATGMSDTVLIGNPHTAQYLMDGLGHYIGQVEQNWGLTNHVVISGKTLLSFESRGGPKFSIEGLTAGQNPSFVVRKAGPHGTTALYPWQAGQDFGPALFENPEYDISNTIADEHSGRVVGASYVDDLRQVKYFDPSLQRVQASLQKAFPGQSVQILSKDNAGSAYLFETDGPRNPPVVSLYTPANHQVNIVQEAYPALKPSDLGEVRPYPYTARDGTNIHAYLTLPQGRTPHGLPMVIFPHGGPEDRDSMNFDWWAQFLASRGYAVLQPNYRGSSGYGRPFTEAADGEWAGKVQDDLEDGVNKLVAEGIADPKKICIAGASWGGYLALGGVSFKPDLYACAISYAGVSDLSHDIYSGTTFESESVSIWRRRIGADKDSGKLDSQSPRNFADRVKVPVLLIHGSHDTTVKVDQSQIEERALRHAGKDVEFITLDGDDHYLEHAETRVRMLKEMERFLAAHLLPASVEVAPKTEAK